MNAATARAALDELAEKWGTATRPLSGGALKCLYLVTRSLDPTGTGETRRAMRWKPGLSAFAITFSDRFPAAETY